MAFCKLAHGYRETDSQNDLAVLVYSPWVVRTLSPAFVVLTSSDVLILGRLRTWLVVQQPRIFTIQIYLILANSNLLNITVGSFEFAGVTELDHNFHKSHCSNMVAIIR